MSVILLLRKRNVVTCFKLYQFIILLDERQWCACVLVDFSLPSFHQWGGSHCFFFFRSNTRIKRTEEPCFKFGVGLKSPLLIETKPGKASLMKRKDAELLYVYSSLDHLTLGPIGLSPFLRKTAAQTSNTNSSYKLRIWTSGVYIC